MKNIAFFVSGGGTDMQAVLDAIDRGEINGKAVFMVASKPEIYALNRAEKHGIPSKVFLLSDYANPEERDLAILAELEKHNVDIVVLAGYLGILTPPLVQKYSKKMINIHPSLIPNHCGKGMYGMRVHKSVIDSGDKVSGATVHYVDEGTDTGEIILQKEVPVLDGDTPEALAGRVLALEHKMLPEVVAQLCKE